MGSEGLPEILSEVRFLASVAAARHTSPLSALCWREVGSGGLKQWSGGCLVDGWPEPDPPAAGESRSALPRSMEEVPSGVRSFIERIEALALHRRDVLSLLGGVDLVVPLDPPALRLPFGAHPAEIGAAALVARAMLLCGPWLVGGGEACHRLGSCLYVAGVVAEAGGVDADAIEAAEHLAVEVMHAAVGGRGRQRAVEFAGA